MRLTPLGCLRLIQRHEVLLHHSFVGFDAVVSIIERDRARRTPLKMLH
jgi:hypothetical protein